MNMTIAMFVFAAIYAVMGIFVLIAVTRAATNKPTKQSIATSLTAILAGSLLVGVLLGE